MQDNSQNKWKTCLEDPENFPGETVPHKNEIWEKLYQRLHNKPRRKLLAWYWAAACLLILVSASVLVFQNGTGCQRCNVGGDRVGLGNRPCGQIRGHGATRNGFCGKTRA